MTSTTALQTSKDFQLFLDFHNNQFCPQWNNVIDTVSKNDQVSLPADKQVSAFDYMKQMEKTWNETQETSVTFVNCSIPIDSGTVPHTLLQIMPKDGQAYVDTLKFMNAKMDLIQSQVQAAVGGISTGSIPTIPTEEFMDIKKLQVACIVDDDGAMNCSDSGNSISCTSSAPLTPAQLKVQENEVKVVIDRAKIINVTVPNLKPQLRKASASVASLKKTTEDAKSGAIYGVKEKPPAPKPPLGHLFFSRY
jgi:hypothetical protein